MFQPTKLAKQSHQLKSLTASSFQPSSTVKGCGQYTYTKIIRGKDKATLRRTGVFDTLSPYHQNAPPAASSKIAWWLMSLLGKAGINTAILKAHFFMREQLLLLHATQGSWQVTSWMQQIGAPNLSSITFTNLPETVCQARSQGGFGGFGGFDRTP